MTDPIDEMTPAPGSDDSAPPVVPGGPVLNGDTPHEKAGDYTSGSIRVLVGVDGIRKHPAMYIGNIGEGGLHHLIYEVVDNSIDKAMAGYCTSISVRLNLDGSVTIGDDGRGIPVDLHKEKNVSACRSC